ncbi:DedA family protein, partial [Streptomyces sp. NPDC058964]|uniref:DedA family protein n=1 Tax=Streptomyces sp. NPDC058964 TaxID=3346681 RepID=UPI0036950852
MSVLCVLLSHESGTAAYGVLAAAVLAESALLVGVFVPSFTLLLTAGALARTGPLNLPVVVAVAALAAVVGDALGHCTGRLGGRMRAGRFGRRVPGTAWRRAEALMHAHGGRAVFIGRFLPVVRTLGPHLAGAVHLPYRRIAPYSALASVLWAGSEAGAGYAAVACAGPHGAGGGWTAAAGVGAAGGAARAR